MYRSSAFRSTLNTGYITGVGMCKLCTEAGHCVALWTRVTLQVWTCVKYVPKQSIPQHLPQPKGVCVCVCTDESPKTCCVHRWVKSVCADEAHDMCVQMSQICVRRWVPYLWKGNNPILRGQKRTMVNHLHPLGAYPPSTGNMEGRLASPHLQWIYVLLPGGPTSIGIRIDSGAGQGWNIGWEEERTVELFGQPRCLM